MAQQAAMQSAQVTSAPDDSDEVVVTVPLEAVTIGPSLREAGISEANVRQLTRLQGAWPPIVVWGPDNLDVDGAHRIVAAGRLGLQRIEVERFTGMADEVFAESVRLNVLSGVPLSLTERTSAARRILTEHPAWSDRRVAELCGLAPKTVGRLRDGEPAELERRVGKNGRAWPLNVDLVRERIRQAIAERPDASLRAIAEDVGASPETVRHVRQQLDAGPEERRTTSFSPTVLELVARPTPPEPRWTRDAAFSSRVDGAEFAAWFDQGAISDDWYRWVGAVPLSRVYEVADDARARASYWGKFAEAIEGCARAPKSAYR